MPECDPLSLAIRGHDFAATEPGLPTKTPTNESPSRILGIVKTIDASVVHLWICQKSGDSREVLSSQFIYTEMFLVGVTVKLRFLLGGQGVPHPRKLPVE